MAERISVESSHHSSGRFETSMRLNTKAVLAIKDIEGIENTEKVPKGYNPVIVVSHLGSNVSFQAVASLLSDRFDLSIAAHEPGVIDKAFRSALDHALDIKLYPITAPSKKDGSFSYAFNVEDYLPMVEGMKRGETIITGGHKATHAGTLPSAPGISGVYLAHKSEQRVVLPVLVDNHTNKFTGVVSNMGKLVFSAGRKFRQPTSIVIGEPLLLDPIDKEAMAIFEQRYSYKSYIREQQSDEEIATARDVHGTLKHQAGLIMQFYASHLPEERRGRWR